MEVSTAAAKVASTLSMTSHPPVTVALVAGAITDISLAILKVTNPEIAGVLAGREGSVTVIVGAVAGYLTRGRP